MSYMYILECNNGTFYTGSTKDLEQRMIQHWTGEGANYTRKHKPLQLVYVEEFQRIDDVFHREKQIQNWSHKKKKALIDNQYETLHNFAVCKNESKADARLRKGETVPSAPLGDLLEIKLEVPHVNLDEFAKGRGERFVQQATDKSSVPLVPRVEPRGTIPANKGIPLNILTSKTFQ